MSCTNLHLWLSLKHEKMGAFGLDSLFGRQSSRHLRQARALRWFKVVCMGRSVSPGLRALGWTIWFSLPPVPSTVRGLQGEEALPGEGGQVSGNGSRGSRGVISATVTRALGVEGGRCVATVTWRAAT